MGEEDDCWLSILTCKKDWLIFPSSFFISKLIRRILLQQVPLLVAYLRLDIG